MHQLVEVYWEADARWYCGKVVEVSSPPVSYSTTFKVLYDDGDVETGQGLPDELFAKLVAARNYRAGSDMLRQIYFSCVDI